MLLPGPVHDASKLTLALERRSRARARVAVVGSVLLLASLAVSCGAARPMPTSAPGWAARLPSDFPLAGQVSVLVDGGDRPPLSLRFPWENTSSVLGWGGAHLWARPGADHVSVSAMIDAPSRQARWADCDRMHVVADGAHMTLPARYIARPEARVDFVYEAMQVQIDIDQLATMAEAETLEANVCGDVMEVSQPQQRAMGRFVQWFHQMAVPDHAVDMPYYRAVGPEPELLPLEEEEPDGPSHG